MRSTGCAIGGLRWHEAPNAPCEVRDITTHGATSERSSERRKRAKRSNRGSARCRCAWRCSGRRDARRASRSRGLSRGVHSATPTKAAAPKANQTPFPRGFAALRHWCFCSRYLSKLPPVLPGACRYASPMAQRTPGLPRHARRYDCEHVSPPALLRAHLAAEQRDSAELGSQRSTDRSAGRR